MLITCEQCGTTKERATGDVKRSRHHFCSRSCSAKYRSKKAEKPCATCEKMIDSSRTYCSVSCVHKHTRAKYIERWLAGKETGSKGSGNTTCVSGHVRTYLLEQSNYQCSICEWGETNPHTGTIPIEIDHIDGNWKRNTPDNLRVLCPNCHALTPTYKGANKGNGQEQRKYSGNRGDYWKEK